MNMMQIRAILRSFHRKYSCVFIESRWIKHRKHKIRQTHSKHPFRPSFFLSRLATFFPENIYECAISRDTWNWFGAFLLRRILFLWKAKQKVRIQGGGIGFFFSLDSEVTSLSHLFYYVLIWKSHILLNSWIQFIFAIKLIKNKTKNARNKKTAARWKRKRFSFRHLPININGIWHLLLVFKCVWWKKKKRFDWGKRFFQSSFLRFYAIFCGSSFKRLRAQDAPKFII